MKKKISIHDLARELKISATTISFVLNGKATEKRISSEVETKILEYIQKVGYKPNLVAQSLRTGKSKIIAMLVESIDDSFFASIAKVIEVTAYKLGYKVFFASTENETEKAKQLIRLFRDRQVDGFIIAPPPGIEKEITALLEDNCPVILFDRHLPTITTTNVLIDNFDGAFSATNHLFENGFKKIAFVTLDSTQSQMQARLDGYQKAIKQAGTVSKILKLSYNLLHTEISEKIKEFLQKNKQLDAVLFATNYLALGGVDAINQLNLKVPENLAIIAFDDDLIFQLLSPSVTAVAQPVQEMSEEVIKQLMKSLAVEDQSAQQKETIILKTKLIVRKSAINFSSVKNLRTAG
ncbi:MAG: LacI family DNA-binding transcriptional regulator [Rhizobacter sp.]|nr:LacI family DNA-binding transcriptional regulator [Ferruginibacter sp.]